MPKYDWLKFGFFFTSENTRSSLLYFACFQRGRSKHNAHQIIIAEVLEAQNEIRKIAYVVSPDIVTSHTDQDLEKLCRIAVTQFLNKLPSDNFLVKALPLDVSQKPWDGGVHAI